MIISLYINDLISQNKEKMSRFVSKIFHCNDSLIQATNRKDMLKEVCFSVGERRGERERDSQDLKPFKPLQ